MIGWIIAGLIAAVAVTVIVVSGIIDKQKLKDEAEKLGIEKAVVDRADHCENIVRFRDLSTGVQYDVKGDGISNEITVGSYI